MKADRRRGPLAAGALADLALSWPLARRALGRYAWRHAVAALLLGLAIAVYLLYAIFLGGANQEARMAVDVLGLPSDIVLMARTGLGADALADVLGIAGVARGETARSVLYHTNLGTMRLVSLPANSGLWPALVGAGGSGLPLPGEVLLPGTVAGALAPGATLTLIPPHAPTARTELRVAGAHLATDHVLGSAALTVMPEWGPWPNTVFLWTKTPGSAGRVASVLETDFSVPSRPILRRTDDSVVLRRETPLAMAAGVTLQTYMPGLGAITMVFVCCGIGLFTLVSLAFVDRRRELGIFKTVGLESRGLLAMLGLEHGVAALLGPALGAAIASACLLWLKPYFPGRGTLGAPAVLAGATAGLLVLGASLALPAAMARAGTAIQLLLGLPISLQVRRYEADRTATRGGTHGQEDDRYR